MAEYNRLVSEHNFFNDGLEKDIKKSIRILPSKDMEGFFISKLRKMQ